MVIFFELLLKSNGIMYENKLAINGNVYNVVSAKRQRFETNSVLYIFRI